jgi:tetratricopeptide (TPR) repeat protein
MSTEGDEVLSAAGALREIRTLLSKRKKREAYELAAQAVVRYGNDPFLLSLFGYLDALVGGKYRSGIDSCTRAIALFEKRALRGKVDTDESQSAPLYLNLGKAYSAAGKRKEAIETLNTGLKHARRDSDLLAELKRLGTRRYIPVPFLKRESLLNEIIGRMLRKKKGEQE